MENKFLLKKYLDILIQSKPQFKGTITAIYFCILSLFSVLLPLFQLLAVSVSLPVLSIAEKLVINQNAEQKCYQELVFTCSVFLTISILTALIFCILHFQNRNMFKFFLYYLILQFFLLQTPLFIGEVGKYYNCYSDGQTVLGVIFSSPKVSLIMIVFGFTYDLLEHNKNKNNPKID